MTMPDHDPAELFERASRVSMSAAEKARMREALARHAHLSPVRTESAGRLTPEGPRLIPSPYPFTFFKPMPITIALLVIALLGGGTSYAAEGALPGDALYPIKIHVNEGLSEAFAFSAKAQANVHADIAAERLSEAAELAAKGALSTTTAASLEARFAENADAATADADALAKQDPAAAAEIDSSLAARIAAHKDILDLFGSEGENAPGVNGLVASLTAHLAAHDEGLASSTAAANLSAEALASLASRANTRLALAQSAYARASGRVGAEATSTIAAALALRAQAALDTANAKLAAGDSARAAGDSVSAYGAYVASLDASAEAKAYADALAKVRTSDAKHRGESHETATSSDMREGDSGTASSSEDGMVKIRITVPGHSEIQEGSESDSAGEAAHASLEGSTSVKTGVGSVDTHLDSGLGL